MANLTIDAADVALVRAYEKLTGPVEEAITAGQMVRINTTNGRFTLANASSAAEGRAVGMAINTVQVGEALTVVKRGLVDLGDALDANDYDDPIELSNTDGALDDGAGTPTASYPVGRVWPIFGSVDGDRLLFVDIAL